MLRILLTVLALAPATIAVAADCIYETGSGPTLSINDAMNAVTIANGKWSETCRLGLAEAPIELQGTGWEGPVIARCEGFDAQFAYVYPARGGSGPAYAIVLGGNVFYRSCR
jgi:hypothetical protein